MSKSFALIMNAPLLTMTGISKRFGATQALRGVSLDVQPGRVLRLGLGGDREHVAHRPARALGQAHQFRAHERLNRAVLGDEVGPRQRRCALLDPLERERQSPPLRPARERLVAL